jgi:hypothetical protein
MAFNQKNPNFKNKAHVAQTVERFLGKEEVHRFDSGRGLQFSLRIECQGGHAVMPLPWNESNPNYANK